MCWCRFRRPKGRKKRKKKRKHTHTLAESSDVSEWFSRVISHFSWRLYIIVLGLLPNLPRVGLCLYCCTCFSFMAFDIRFLLYSFHYCPSPSGIGHISVSKLGPNTLIANYMSQDLLFLNSRVVYKTTLARTSYSQTTTWLCSFTYWSIRTSQNVIYLYCGQMHQYAVRNTVVRRDPNSGAVLISLSITGNHSGTRVFETS